MADTYGSTSRGFGKMTKATDIITYSVVLPVLICAQLILSSPAIAQALRAHFLVVGNSKYKNLSVLDNAWRDAELMCLDGMMRVRAGQERNSRSAAVP
jgi:hypothetical protein